MTAEQTADGEVEALEGSMLDDGLTSILATGGGEAAGRRRQRRDSRLVETDGRYQEQHQETTDETKQGFKQNHELNELNELIYSRPQIYLKPRRPKGSRATARTKWQLNEFYEFILSAIRHVKLAMRSSTAEVARCWLDCQTKATSNCLSGAIASTSSCLWSRHASRI